MRSSTRLREAIHHTLQECDNDLEAQKLASEYALRKRIHETERAKKELEWQKKNVSFTSLGNSLLDGAFFLKVWYQRCRKFWVKSKIGNFVVIIPLNERFTVQMSVCTFFVQWFYTSKRSFWCLKLFLKQVLRKELSSWTISFANF